MAEKIYKEFERKFWMTGRGRGAKDEAVILGEKN